MEPRAEARRCDVGPDPDGSGCGLENWAGYRDSTRRPPNGPSLRLLYGARACEPHEQSRGVSRILLPGCASPLVALQGRVDGSQLLLRLSRIKALKQADPMSCLSRKTAALPEGVASTALASAASSTLRATARVSSAEYCPCCLKVSRDRG